MIFMNIIGIGIILSFLITIIIGLVVGKKVKGSTLNFTVAGRSLSVMLVSLALVAEAIDGNATLGNTTLSFGLGFWAGAVLPIGLAISLFLLGLFFAERLNSLKLITLADLFERKFNSKVGFIASIVMIFAFGVLIAGNIAAISILLQAFFPISYESSVILIFFILLLYIFRGGFFSSIYANIFQMSILALGIIFTFLFLFVNYGFIGFSSSDVITQKFSFSQLYSIGDGALINWATIVALGFGNLIAIDFAQRIFSAKSPKDAKKSCYWAAFFTLVLGLPFSFLVIYILKLDLVGEANIPIILTLSQKVLPPFIALFLITGIIHAALSTIAGSVLSMGNILTRNLLNIKPELLHGDDNAEKTALYFFRISLVPIACCAMIFALLLPTPGVLLSVAFDIAFAALLIPFIFAFSDKYAYAQAALYAIIFGGGSRIIFATLTPTLFGIGNPFYIPNSFIPASWDGLATILSPLLALIVYLIVLNTRKKYTSAVEQNRRFAKIAS